MRGDCGLVKAPRQVVDVQLMRSDDDGQPSACVLLALEGAALAAPRNEAMSANT